MNDKTEDIINQIDYVRELIQKDRRKLTVLDDHLKRYETCLKIIRQEATKNDKIQD